MSSVFDLAYDDLKRTASRIACTGRQLLYSLLAVVMLQERYLWTYRICAEVLRFVWFLVGHHVRSRNQRQALVICSWTLMLGNGRPLPSTAGAMLAGCKP